MNFPAIPALDVLSHEHMILDWQDNLPYSPSVERTLSLKLCGFHKDRPIYCLVDGFLVSRPITTGSSTHQIVCVTHVVWICKTVIAFIASGVSARFIERELVVGHLPQHKGECHTFTEVKKLCTSTSFLP